MTSVPLLMTLPLDGWVTASTASGPASTELSLVSTSIVTAVSSSVVFESSVATGASSTLCTVTVNVSFTEPPLESEAVTVTSAVPF